MFGFGLEVVGLGIKLYFWHTTFCGLSQSDVLMLNKVGAVQFRSMFWSSLTGPHLMNMLQLVGCGMTAFGVHISVEAWPCGGGVAGVDCCGNRVGKIDGGGPYCALDRRSASSHTVKLKIIALLLFFWFFFFIKLFKILTLCEKKFLNLLFV